MMLSKMRSGFVIVGFKFPTIRSSPLKYFKFGQMEYDYRNISSKALPPELFLKKRIDFHSIMAL